MARYGILILEDGDSSDPCIPDGFIALSRYSSGRPCVTAFSRTSDYSVADERIGKLVVFGDHGVRERIKTLFRSAADIEVFSREVCEIGGRWVAVTHHEKVIYCHQPFLTRDPMFWSVRGRGRIASTDLGRLVQGCGTSDLNTVSLALSVMPLGAPWPFNRTTIWNGVNRVSVGERLEIRGSGVKVTRVWHLPETCADRDQVVHDLSSLLPAVVSTLVGSDDRVGVDCSGGLDSTAVVYMLRHCACNIDAYHYVASNPSNEDHVWASRVLSDIAIKPRLIGNEIANIFFRSDVEVEEPETGGPFLWGAGRMYLRAVAKSSTDNGVTSHFTGFGGDELFTSMPAQLWSHYQRYGFSSLLTLRRAAKRNRVKLVDLYSEARSATPFHSDLLESWTFSGGRSAVDLSWGNAMEIPDWVHHDALQAVGEAVRLLYDQEIQPLSPDRARHQALASLSYEAELLDQISSRFGRDVVEWQSPFLDCEVVLASLMLDVGDRTEAGRGKSLLKDSMRGMVPSSVLERRNKGDYSMELYRAMEANRESLRSYFDECYLMDLGIVDADRLRRAVLSGVNDTAELHAIQSTLEAERWLRNMGSRHPGV